MVSRRLPRFRRSPEVRPIRITERDREIIRLIHRHRFLRSTHILALVGGSPSPLARRLQVLYHHGYVERPRAKLDYYHAGGPRPIAYGIGNKGAALLKRENVPIPHLRWGEKNRSVGRIYLEHALLVSDFLVALLVSCRRSGVRHIRSDELLRPGEPLTSGWKVSIGGDLKLGVVPDAVFALESNGTRILYFLEADRGTMPVKRSNLNQTSMYRKFVTYAASWKHSIHQTRFGVNRVRVLMVTKCPERVNSLVQACAQTKHGTGLFLFAATEILNQPDILAASWRTARPGQTATLLT